MYNKGAEVIRMMHTLLGQEGFRRGMDAYFKRHDGQAVICDDFVAAMEDANDVDLEQFRRWYHQAGTPRLAVERDYDPARERYTLTLQQSCSDTPGQTDKKPFHIPIALGLLDAQGHNLPLQLEGENAPGQNSAGRVVELREPSQTFHFVNIPEEPIPSLLRGFSAPVKLELDYTDAELMFLLAHDSDDFNRWEAGQQLAVRTILNSIELQQSQAWPLEPQIGTAFRQALCSDADSALLAQVLTLPSETYLSEQMNPVDVDGIHNARRAMRQALAIAMRDDLWRVYRSLNDCSPYQIDAAAIGRRSLKNICLNYLLQLDDPQTLTLCLEQLHNADNMTDELAALHGLANRDCSERESALADFYQRWQHEALVVDKWFALQATSELPNTLTQVKSLMAHAAFNLKNPNKVRALIGAFCHGNPAQFHAQDGSGYVFLADQVLELNGFNPQVAARMLGAMTRWRKYDAGRQTSMRKQLERILAHPTLSRDVYEIASKSLENA